MRTVKSLVKVNFKASGMIVLRRAHEAKSRKITFEENKGGLLDKLAPPQMSIYMVQRAREEKKKEERRASG